jgi:hypothetical protein
MDEVSPWPFDVRGRAWIPAAAKKSFCQGIRASQNVLVTIHAQSGMRVSKAAKRKNSRIKAAL